MRRSFMSVMLGVVIGFGANTAAAETQTLEQALALAYQGNPSLQAARAKLRATDEQVSQALSGWRPSIEATAETGKTWQRTPGNTAVPASSNLTPRQIGVNVTQPLFRGFRTTASVRGAEASVFAERAALVDAEQHLMLDAATAYLDVLQNQSVVEINRDNEQVLQQQLIATRERFQIGELKRTDVDQAESRLNVAMAARIQAESDLANRRTTFARLVGDMPGTLTQPKLSMNEAKSADDVITLAQKSNPSVVAATYSQDAAREDVTVSEGALLPEISLVGNVSRGWEQDVTIPGQRDEASIMVRATIPLYKAGTDYSKTRAAHQTVTQRRLELEEARHKAHEEAMNAWLALTTARATIETNKAAVVANEHALEGVREESKVGTRTTLDVLNAQQELLNAKVNLVKAQHDESVAILKIKAAIGSLTAEGMHLPVTTYDPNAHYEDVRGKWIGLGASEE